MDERITLEAMRDLVRDVVREQLATVRDAINAQAEARAEPDNAQDERNIDIEHMLNVAKLKGLLMQDCRVAGHLEPIVRMLHREANPYGVSRHEIRQRFEAEMKVLRLHDASGLEARKIVPGWDLR